MFLAKTSKLEIGLAVVAISWYRMNNSIAKAIETTGI